MKHLLTLLAALTCVATLAQEKIRVACVGNSVTYGYGLPDREQNSYPHQLQLMLGDGYEVGNFGHSGATLLRNAYRPYHTLPEYRQALDFQGDIVIIHLGLNDTDPRAYEQRREEFIPDYRQLIDSLRAVNPSCKVYLCLMTPIFQGHHRFLSGTRDWHAQIQQDIRRVAEGAEAGLIDLYTPLHCRPDLFPDNLHPNPQGARILAETVYNAITGYAHVPLSLPEVYQSGMVLQREAENVVSGRAPAGCGITLKFNGKKYKATTDGDGRWSVTLPAMKAGGPYRLSVNAECKMQNVKLPNSQLSILNSQLSIDSIWLGEVWLCSGQSNMEWVSGSIPPEYRPQPDPRLHLYRMEGLRNITSDEAWSQEQLRATNDLRFIRPARWQTATQEAIDRFSAIACHAGKRIADSLDCHVGLIANAIGGSGIESWIDRTSTEWQMPEVLMAARPAKCDFLQDWVRKCIATNTTDSQDPLQRHPFDPCYLYESSIVPLEGLTLRGVMWYQGESNAHNLEFYARQWQALTRQWRSVFRSADGQPLPFYTMQLASISGRPSWGRFRDLQRRLADSDPRTHLVVTHDVGEQWNVHPRRKDIQGARLAQTILKGEESPTVTRISRKKDCVTLTFSEPLCGTPTEFELAGPDGLYHPATATLNGNSLTLRSTRVPHPVALRYASTDFTQARLRSQRTGLLVSTFYAEIE